MTIYIVEAIENNAYFLLRQNVKAFNDKQAAFDYCHQQNVERSEDDCWFEVERMEVV